ncbi:serine hydrolase-like protein 2 isoform X4 [Falco peregrinus]|uniref:serine hydrolase-like protein 2 isoform X4 n=1 Tax=Falco peregrinus TaxID=8954 RepID=UPI0024788AB2|nr:serine hydrolase-like protein 2 isoform X4 [Falco peregrinus]
MARPAAGLRPPAAALLCAPAGRSELWAINKIPGTYLSAALQGHHFILGMFSELKFPVPWGHVAAKAWGSSEGHPVLCLHGWLDNANTFDKLIPLLPRGCYYVAMDFSGHGLSSHRPAGSPYHFLDYVTDVRRVAAALQWRRFTLMGHSMGGSVAGMFCSLYPEMVDKLILLESLGFMLAAEDTDAWLKSKRMVIDRLLSLEAKQQTPKARSPEAALQRLLEANRHLTAEGGAILLQRGATETPAAESGGLHSGAVRGAPAEDPGPCSHHSSTRWTFGTAQARQQKSLCENSTGGV